MDKDRSPRPLQTVLLASACVLVAEAAVGMLAEPDPDRPVGLAQAALLLALLVPLFYLLVCRPLQARLFRFEDENRRLATRLAARERDQAERIDAEALLAAERRRDAVLGEVLALLQSCRSTEEACGVIARHGRALFPGSSGGVYLYDTGDARLSQAACWGAWPEDGEPFDPRDCRALGLGRIHVLADQRSSLCRHLTVRGGQASICIPLRVHGATLGLITMVMDDHAPRDERRAAGHAAIAARTAWGVDLSLAYMRLRETARQQAVRDPVTGLINRRYVDEAWTRELARAGRHAATLGVAVLSVEGLAAIGARAGDALCEIGYLLDLSLRAEDGAFRLDEERFLLLLPGAPADALERRVEELRQSIEGLCAAHGGPPGAVTVAGGTALFPRDGRRREELLQAACRALERARRETGAHAGAADGFRAGD